LFFQETKQKSLEEIDLLFERTVGPREATMEQFDIQMQHLDKEKMDISGTNVEDIRFG
jgi:hypothetical protein